MTCRNCYQKILITDFICGTEFYWCQKHHKRCEEVKQKECNGCNIITNADKIRSMTDEELAEFIEGDYGNFETGKAIVWLKQPAEGE